MYLPWFLEYEQVPAVVEGGPGYAREPVREAEGRNEVDQHPSGLASSLDTHRLLWRATALQLWILSREAYY